MKLTGSEGRNTRVGDILAIVVDGVRGEPDEGTDAYGGVDGEGTNGDAVFNSIREATDEFGDEDSRKAGSVGIASGFLA